MQTDCAGSTVLDQPPLAFNAVAAEALVKVGLKLAYDTKGVVTHLRLVLEQNRAVLTIEHLERGCWDEADVKQAEADQMRPMPSDQPDRQVETRRERRPCVHLHENILDAHVP